MYKFGYDGEEFKVYAPGDEDGETSRPLIHLPHQCDEWIIGDVDNARLMIRDLKAAIERTERGTV